MPVDFTCAHHGPQGAGHLVGQGDIHELARLSLQQFQQPGRGGFASWLGMSDDGGTPDDERLSQALIAGFADPSQPLLAAG